MEKLHFQIAVWKCPNIQNCKYIQDTDPYSDFQNHPSMFPQLPKGFCPNCLMRQRGRFAMEKISSESPTMTHTSSDHDLESQQDEDRDAHGNPIMVESGQYRDKLINDNGTPRFVQEPVMVPKMVTIPKAKSDALKLQRDQSLDSLEAIADKEVVEPKVSPD